MRDNPYTNTRNSYTLGLGKSELTMNVLLDRAGNFILDRISNYIVTSTTPRTS